MSTGFSPQALRPSAAHAQRAPSLEETTTNCADTHSDWFFFNRGTGEIRPYKCRQWGCSECGRVKQARWIVQVSKWAGAKGLGRFATLTFDRRYDRAKNKWDYVQEVWARFRRELQRKYPKGVTFVRVLEPCPSTGRLHLHVLYDRYIHQRWLSGVWAFCGGGPVVDIRYKDEQRVSRYLSKYLAKAVRYHFPKGRRRWTSSRDIRLWDDPGQPRRVKQPSGWAIWMGGTGVRYSEDDVRAIAGLPDPDVVASWEPG
jgi:hypothetical protein